MGNLTVTENISLDFHQIPVLVVILNNGCGWSWRRTKGIAWSDRGAYFEPSPGVWKQWWWEGAVEGGLQLFIQPLVCDKHEQYL